MVEKNSLESVVGIHGYRTSQLLGTGGFIKRNFDDFVVREILPNGKILINGSEIGEDLGGMFTHCCLWKSGLDTFSAIKILSNHWNISEDDIGYAGLKDANAETYQRISIWNYYITDLHTSVLPNLKVFHPVRQKFAVKIGDLLGNHFEITIRNIKRAWSINEWEELKNSLESEGVLNFYGLQRFGTKRPILHLIGMNLLQEKYSKVIDIYLGDTSSFEHESITRLRDEYSKTPSYRKLMMKYPNSYRFEKLLLEGLEKKFSSKKTVLKLPQSFLRLAISAYQSYVFNNVLSFLNQTNFHVHDKLAIPLPGFQTKEKKINEIILNKIIELLEEDNLNLKSFAHPIKNLRSKGALRNAIVIPENFDHFTKRNEEYRTKVSFNLSKGSYATIVIREITKND